MNSYYSLITLTTTCWVLICPFWYYKKGLLKTGKSHHKDDKGGVDDGDGDEDNFLLLWSLDRGYWCVLLVILTINWPDTAQSESEDFNVLVNMDYL